MKTIYLYVFLNRFYTKYNLNILKQYNINNKHKNSDKLKNYDIF